MIHLSQLTDELKRSKIMLDGAVADMLETDQPQIFRFPDGFNTIPSADIESTYDFAKQVSEAGQLCLPSEVTVFQLNTKGEKYINAVDEVIIVMLHKPEGIAITWYDIVKGRGVASCGHMGIFANGMVTTGLDPQAEPIVREALAQQGEDVEDALSSYTENTGQITLHAMALLVFLSSKSAKIEGTNDMSTLNKARVKRGKPPLREFKEVTLKIPSVANSSADGVGTHASPKMHHRRGHIRVLASGKFCAVAPCWVGSSELGIIDKTYKVEGPEHETL